MAVPGELEETEGAWFQDAGGIHFVPVIKGIEFSAPTADPESTPKGAFLHFLSNPDPNDQDERSQGSYVIHYVVGWSSFEGPYRYSITTIHEPGVGIVDRTENIISLGDRILIVLAENTGSAIRWKRDLYASIHGGSNPRSAVASLGNALAGVLDVYGIIWVRPFDSQEREDEAFRCMDVCGGYYYRPFQTLAYATSAFGRLDFYIQECPEECTYTHTST